MIFLSGSDNVSLHMFPDPDNDADRFRTWLYTIGGDILQLDNQKILKYRKVCDCHFEEIYRTHSKRLSANAVPTLYVPGQLVISFDYILFYKLKKLHNCYC